jgi:mRNA interferase HigB
MHVLSRKTLEEFWAKHTDAKAELHVWFHEAKRAEWRSFQEIKRRYASADVLPGNRVVFNIKGNRYRLIVHIHYNTGTVYIRFVGTHAEYDRINAETI